MMAPWVGPSRARRVSTHRHEPTSALDPGGGRLPGSTRRRCDAEDERDRREARRTVPRGTNATDAERTPGVDIDVWALHVRYQRTRSTDALTALVEQYESYATSIAHGLLRHGEPLEDIQQVALEALVSSLQRFDVERGLPFPAFARPTISGAIKRHYRDRGWSVRTPRSVHDIAAPLRDAHETLTAELGRTPTDAEVAAALGVEETAIRTARQTIRARAATSLDQPGPDGGPSRVESMGGLDPDLQRAEDHVALQEAMVHLDERERTLLGHYFYENMTQREIGAHYGVSQMQVSRWLTNTLARLRRRVEAA